MCPGHRRGCGGIREASDQVQWVAIWRLAIDDAKSAQRWRNRASRKVLERDIGCTETSWFRWPPPPISEAVERYERFLVEHGGDVPFEVATEFRMEQMRIGDIDRFLKFAKLAARVHKRLGYKSTWPDGFWFIFPTDAELEAPDQEDDEDDEDDEDAEGADDETSARDAKPKPDDWRVW